MTEQPDHWGARALCATRDPRLWDPQDSTELGRAAQRYGAAICARCPVADNCKTAVTPAEAGCVRAGGLVTSVGGLEPIPEQPPVWKPVLAPCGGVSAARRHIGRGENCETCRVKDGHRLRGPQSFRPITAPCGGASARTRHVRRGESCFTCWPETGRPRAWRRTA